MTQHQALRQQAGQCPKCAAQLSEVAVRATGICPTHGVQATTPACWVTAPESNWEVRNSRGDLLPDSFFVTPVDELFINLRPGVGG